MNDKTQGIMAVSGSSAAIFWPGAFIFGFPGVMGPLWQNMFQVGKGPIGNTLFFVLAAVGFFMFFVGHWQERFGTRKMISIGALLCGLNAFLIAYASTLPILYLWAFLNGTASCFIYIPALTTVQRWFPEKKGLVSGIVNLAFGASAAIMAPVFGHLLNSMGYFTMNIILAGAALLMGVGAAWFTGVPEMHSNLRPKGQDIPVRPMESERSLTVIESLQTKNFWFLWLTWAFQGAAGIAMVVLSVNFGLSHGLAVPWAVMILSSFNITNGLSRIIMGFLSDKWGRTGIMSLTFFAAGCAYLILPHMNTFPALIILSAIIGFAFGTLFAVSAPLVADCFGMKHFGAILGLVFTAYGFLSGILGPSLGGYLLDLLDDNYFIVFNYLGMFCLLSGFFIRRVVPPERVRKIKV
ncbi:MAG: MFS transporter [Deltaproteobacteria bacterium]|nr:MFS transporter [Deltaproteobacteria bacterium]